MSLRIKKNDRVKVLSGKDKGTVSRVVAVMPAKERALVEHVNMVKRHTRARGQGQPGGIIEKEAPIHLSNLALYCEACKTGVRFGSEVRNNEKVRVCKKCGVAL
ncbi:MAG: 50S ribosomal protein L24 [Candidatus Sumerlaeaceae bacterium]